MFATMSSYVAMGDSFLTVDLDGIVAGEQPNLQGNLLLIARAVAGDRLCPRRHSPRNNIALGRDGSRLCRFGTDDDAIVG